MLPDRLKNASSIETFKMQIKNWKPKIVHVRFAKFTFKMTVLFKSISIEGKERKLSCEIYKFMILWDFDLMISFQRLEIDVNEHVYIHSYFLS